jgi:hypothetical protein
MIRVVIATCCAPNPRALALALFSTFSPLMEQARAGAFNQEEGRGQVILTEAFSSADQGYDIGGKLTSASRFQKSDTTALIEYGFTDWLTAIVKPSFSNWRLSGPPDATYTGIGTSEIGAQAQLLKLGSSVFAVQAMARVPGSNDGNNLALQGNTHVEEELRALAGHGFQLGSWASFVDVQVGYRWRYGPPSEWHGDVTLGTRPSDNVMLLLQSFNASSRSSTSTVFPRNSLSKLQASIVYDFTKALSGQIGAFQSIAGENALKERGLIAAVWYRF